VPTEKLKLYLEYTLSLPAVLRSPYMLIITKATQGAGDEKQINPWPGFASYMGTQ
jgi:hypothetical protein